MKKITAVLASDVRPERVCELSVGHRVRRRDAFAGAVDAGIAFASDRILRRRLIRQFDRSQGATPVPAWRLVRFVSLSEQRAVIAQDGPAPRCGRGRR